MIKVEIEKETLKEFVAAGSFIQLTTELSLIVAKLFIGISKSDSTITYDFLVKSLYKTLTENKELILHEMESKKDAPDASV